MQSSHQTSQVLLADNKIRGDDPNALERVPHLAGLGPAPRYRLQVHVHVRVSHASRQLQTIILREWINVDPE